MTLYHFYRLVNNVDDRCYIGVTKRELRKRLYDHRHQPNSGRCSSKQMVEQYGKSGVDIVLIHSLEYDNIREAHREERRLIEEYRGRCVNIQMPYRTEEEKPTLQRIYNETHKDEIKARAKAYYEANKERLKLSKEVMSKRNKAYIEANREKEKARKLAWYEANKEAINAKRREARAKKANTKPEPTVADNES